jgi:hypothetical protein
MNAELQVASWLKEFSFRQGTQFSLNDRNECYLQSKNGIQLTIAAPAGDQVYMSSVLGRVEDGIAGDSIIKAALIKNLYQNETMGGCLALDPSIEALMWCITRSISKLDYAEFENMVTNIFDVSDALKNELFSSMNYDFSTYIKEDRTEYLQV